jgi:Na+-driven multidrug efflux pump
MISRKPSSIRLIVVILNIVSVMPLALVWRTYAFVIAWGLGDAPQRTMDIKLAFYMFAYGPWVVLAGFSVASQWLLSRGRTKAAVITATVPLFCDISLGLLLVHHWYAQ